MAFQTTNPSAKKVSILALMTALLALVYIFGASPYANDGTFGTLQAQGNNGAITGLTLTSNAPETLTVPWDAASPTPTDYQAWTGPRPARTTRHGGLTRAMSIRRKPP